MKILIVYGTTEGQTRKIARYMEEYLQSKGHAVTISDASDDPPTPDGYDVVLLGGSLHMMKHQASLAHYAAAHAEKLNRMPGVFFSVSLGVVTGAVLGAAQAAAARRGRRASPRWVAASSLGWGAAMPSSAMRAW